MISFNSGDKVDENASAMAEAMAFVGAKPKIYGIPAYKTEDNKNGKATSNS
jgi:hypothetical protein